MKWPGLILVFVVGLALAWMLGLIGGSGIDANTPVRVLTTDPVRVLLPVDARATLIEARIREELTTSSADQRDPRMASHMTDLAADAELMDHIAATSYDQFDGRVAAGIAFGLYDVAIDDDVVLFSVTVELLPSFYGVGETLSHEDGHWLVNSGVAQRCGPRIVREASSGALFPGQARASILGELQRTDEAVHNDYHRRVVGARSGQYRTAALEALDSVIGPSCTRRP